MYLKIQILIMYDIPLGILSYSTVYFEKTFDTSLDFYVIIHFVSIISY